MIQEGIPFMNADDLIDGHVFLQGSNKETSKDWRIF